MEGRDELICLIKYLCKKSCFIMTKYKVQLKTFYYGNKENKNFGDFFTLKVHHRGLGKGTTRSRLLLLSNLTSKQTHRPRGLEFCGPVHSRKVRWTIL